MKEATFGQAEKILSIFNETPSEQLQVIIESGLLADIRDGNILGVDRDAFRKIVGLKLLNIYAITVDYDLSVDDAAKAGNYGEKDSDINSKNFSTKKSGIAEVDVELVHFNRDMSTEEVLKELDRRGQRPADINEILNLGEKFPNLQREFPIIALGSVWQGPSGFRFCACLCRVGSKRYLVLDWIGFRWNGNCRFAAVRKYLVEP